MALWAEWDPTTGNVVQVKNDDQQPGQLSSGFTGADRTTGAETTWYPLETEFPEDYVPRFPELLGPGHMYLEDGVVVQRFPRSDFSEAAVRSGLVAEVKRSSKSALADTDWYVTRLIETGRGIPDAVKAERLRIRAQADSMEQAIHEAAPSEILVFETVIKTDRQAFVGSPANSVPR